MSVSYLELRQELVIIEERLNKTTRKRLRMEQANSITLLPINLIPERVIEFLKRRERDLTEEYLCLEQFLSEQDEEIEKNIREV